MKLWLVLMLIVSSFVVNANDPYRAYLLSKIIFQENFKIHKSAPASIAKSNCVIPRFERPKGAVFCRMEDYLTTKTKVWIKVGVH